jgi:hypothetical protein
VQNYASACGLKHNRFTLFSNWREDANKRSLVMLPTGPKLTALTTGLPLTLNPFCSDPSN